MCPLVFQAVTTIQGQITSCASSISQAAGLAALGVSDEEMQVSFDVMRKKVRRGRRDVVDLNSPCATAYVRRGLSSHRYSSRRRGV